MEIEEIKKISVKSLEPGDLIVLKLKNFLSTQATKNLKECIEEFLRKEIGIHNKILVLEDGADIEILKRGEGHG